MGSASYQLYVGETATEIKLTDAQLILNQTPEIVTIELDDVLSFKEKENENRIDHRKRYEIDVIKHSTSEWSVDKLDIYGHPDEVEKFSTNLESKLKSVSSKRPKRILVLINPVGGGRKAESIFKDKVKPLFDIANISLDVKVSERPKHVVEIIKTYDLKTTDSIVFLGGDGTYTEIMNTLMRITQEECGVDMNDPSKPPKPPSIPMGIIPTGTFNVIGNLCYQGSQDIVTATLAIIKGQTKLYGVGAVYHENALVAYTGVGTGQGYIAEMMYRRDASRHLGTFTRVFLLPVWNFIYNGLRCCDMEITVYTREKKTCTENESADEYVDKEECIKCEALTMMTVQWILKTINGKPKMVAPSGSTHPLLLYRRCSRWQVLKHYYHLFRGKLEEDFLSYFDVTGYKLKVTDRETETEEAKRFNHMINIDGETHELKTADIEYRYFPNSVLMYTSCPEED